MDARKQQSKKHDDFMTPHEPLEEDPYDRLEADQLALNESDARLEAATALVRELRDALGFYVSICGNTAYAVSRESAREMYDKANPALEKANAFLTK